MVLDQITPSKVDTASTRPNTENSSSSGVRKMTARQFRRLTKEVAQAGKNRLDKKTEKLIATADHLLAINDLLVRENRGLARESQV